MFNDKPIKLKNYGYPQHSIVRHGLDVVAKAISEIVCNSCKIIVSIRLVCKLNISTNTVSKCPLRGDNNPSPLGEGKI